MEMSGQLYGPAVITPGKEVFIGEESEWVTEPM
jgi:hypothetical protein